MNQTKDLDALPELGKYVWKHFLGNVAFDGAAQSWITHAKLETSMILYNFQTAFDGSHVMIIDAPVLPDGLANLRDERDRLTLNPNTNRCWSLLVGLDQVG